MPSALAFDTHANVKRLIRSGMPEAQAEALVEMLSNFNFKANPFETLEGTLMDFKRQLIGWIVGSNLFLLVLHWALVLGEGKGR